MIYIFGAAFDPPHVAHSAIIRAILHYKNPELIVVIPSGIRDDKTYSIENNHRRKLCELFLAEINDTRVILDLEFFSWMSEMTTKDVDTYAREKYGENIIHVFGTDTALSMPYWDSEGYAARTIQKLFVPRVGQKYVPTHHTLKKIMEGSWCRFSPGEGGVRGGFIEYNPTLRLFATENRKKMNKPEKILWSFLRAKSFGYKFHRQKPLGEFIVDFYSSDLHLVIEIDGESHVENAMYDEKRTKYINSLGIHVLRYTNKEVMENIEGVIQDIGLWIKMIVDYMDSLLCNPSQPPLLRGGAEENLLGLIQQAGIENYELFMDSHIPDISSTSIREIIPEYTSLKTYFEEHSNFIIPGLSKHLSRYILENRLYRKEVTEKPRVLVHICCGPDAVMPILDLRDEYEVICFWYDPNIQPKSEYDKRYEAFVQVCTIEGIPYIKGAYDVKHFFARIKGLEHTPEKGDKCTNCYDMRMYVAAKLAHRLGIKYYTSSLNTSPKKDLEKLFKIGHEYARKYGITFLDIPFRKRGGFEKSVEYTRKNNIYRQNYCGCIYSLHDGGKQG